MGEDTKLLISNRWVLDEVKTVIEKYLKTEVKVKSCHITSIGMFKFNFKVNNHARTMYVHSNYNTPIGTGTYLSLGHNDEAVNIMRTIANVLGGFLLENDCDGDYEHIKGMFSENNGLSYLFKYAVLNNELKDENDLVGLNKSIHQWHKRVKDDISKMNLFEVEDGTD